MTMKSADWCEKFVGTFVKYTNYNSQSDLPEGYYRIEGCLRREPESDRFYIVKRFSEHITVSLSSKSGKEYSVMVSSFHEDSWAEVEDRDTVGWLALQWA